GGTHTATGVSQVIQQATMRITEIVNVLDYRSMRPFGWMMEQLNAQYFEQSAVIDFSDDPAAQQAWQQLVEEEQPVNVWDRVMHPFRSSTVEPTETQPLTHLTIEPHMVNASGRLDQIPQVGPAGPSADNAPTGGVVGAAGAAGGVGTFGMGPGR